MNYTLVIGSVCAAVLFYYAAAQSFEDPKRYYKPMQFDVKVRGSFNTTPCLRDLLNCWEWIRPDMFCTRQTYMSTLCEVRVQMCSDTHGYEKDGFTFNKMFHAFNLKCPPYRQNSYDFHYDLAFGFPYSRRRAPSPGPGSGLPGAPDDTVMFWL